MSKLQQFLDLSKSLLDTNDVNSAGARNLREVESTDSGKSQESQSQSESEETKVNMQIGLDVVFTCINGDCFELGKLISSGRCVNIQDKSKNSPLHYSVATKNLECTEMLLSQPDLELEVENLEGVTPLVHACRIGSLSQVKMLLARGCDPNHSNKMGLLPIDVAENDRIKRVFRDQKKKEKAYLSEISSGDVGTVKKALGKVFNVNANTASGESAISLAVQGEDKLPLLKVLVEKEVGIVKEDIHVNPQYAEFLERKFREQQLWAITVDLLKCCKGINEEVYFLSVLFPSLEELEESVDDVGKLERAVEMHELVKSLTVEVSDLTKGFMKEIETIIENRNLLSMLFRNLLNVFLKFDTAGILDFVPKTVIFLHELYHHPKYKKLAMLVGKKENSVWFGRMKQFKLSVLIHSPHHLVKRMEKLFERMNEIAPVNVQLKVKEVFEKYTEARAGLERRIRRSRSNKKLIVVKKMLMEKFDFEFSKEECEGLQYIYHEGGVDTMNMFNKEMFTRSLYLFNRFLLVVTVLEEKVEEKRSKKKFSFKKKKKKKKEEKKKQEVQITKYSFCDRSFKFIIWALPQMIRFTRYRSNKKSDRDLLFFLNKTKTKADFMDVECKVIDRVSISKEVADYLADSTEKVSVE